jgi:hypothetical protein
VEANERIAADMEVFAQVGSRHAGAEGERTMLRAVAARLPEGAAHRDEPFVAHTSPAIVLALHDLALLLAGIVGWWSAPIGAVASTIATVSLLAEGTGRTSLFRWWMSRRASANLVVRVPCDKPSGTLVIATPLDAPPWRPIDVRSFRGLRPMQVTVGAALLVTAMLVLRSLAEPWGPRTLELYVVALIILALGVLGGMLTHRRAGVGRDDGSGAAVGLELMRQFRAKPLANVDVWFAFTGCGRAYQGGMEAFLALHRQRFVHPVLVVAVEDPARGELQAVVAEGPLYPHHHRPTGPALIERLRWAGLKIPSIDHIGSTDARVAQSFGYRAVALVGHDGPSRVESGVRAVEIVETMGRWFADDLARMRQRD